MKILAIRGRNLASLEGDFEIDLRWSHYFQPGYLLFPGLREQVSPPFGYDVLSSVRPYASYRPGERK